MRDRALEVVATRPAGTDGVNVLREYLLSRVLGHLQLKGAFTELAFMGGTALRFLYRIPRFSEDLDFTAHNTATRFDLAEFSAHLERELRREGYDVDVRAATHSTVQRATVAFSGLLAQAGLSPHADQTLRIKVEVDTDPPAGAGLSVTTINRYGLLRLQHHDLPSLFAGKTAAVLAREYTKGRDLYDLMWYLTHDPPVELNRTLLHTALLQTAPTLAEKAASNPRAALREHLADVDWAAARLDVRPFLEQSRDLDLIAPDVFAQLLG